MKKSVLFIFFILNFSFLHAEKITTKIDNTYFEISYNAKAYPGDAEFVRMTLTSLKKSEIKELKKTSALLSLYLDDKKISSSDFYFINQQSSSSVTLLTGLPLSSWWKENENCLLKISYSFTGKNFKEIKLPFKILKKDFVSETLYLDEKNTSIKTDNSLRRQKDIEKLNAILSKTDSKALWQTKSFSLPVTSKRRTSFFADRRIYKYNTGSSQTGLHHGIDFGIKEGTEVYASAGGKVLLAEDRLSTGYSIVIEHLPGLYSLYYHLSEMNVKEGDFVKEGEKIALSGSTGLATGPHLHWEVRLLMQSVNPDFFLTDFTFEKEQ